MGTLNSSDKTPRYLLTVNLYNATVDDSCGQVHTSCVQDNNPMLCTSCNLITQRATLKNAVEVALTALQTNTEADMSQLQYFYCYPIRAGKNQPEDPDVHNYRVIYGEYVKPESTTNNKPHIVMGCVPPDENSKMIRDASQALGPTVPFIMVYREDTDYQVDVRLHLVNPSTISHYDSTKQPKPAPALDDDMFTVLEGIATAQIK